MSKSALALKVKRATKGDFAVAKKEEEKGLTFGRALDEYGLTLKQYNFVHYYIAGGGNGTDAARKAYAMADDSTAAVTAFDNLRKPNIRKAIDDIVSKQLATPEFVKSRFLRLALHATKESDQLSATDKLAKIHGMYTEKTIERTVQTVKVMLPPGIIRKVVDIDAKNVADISEE